MDEELSDAPPFLTAVEGVVGSGLPKSWISGNHRKRNNCGNDSAKCLDVMYLGS